MRINYDMNYSIRFKRYNPYEYKKIVEDIHYVDNRQKSYLTKQYTK